MTRGWRLGGMGLAGLWLAACKHDAGPVVPVEPAALYDSMCLRCHGADGRGDPEMAKLMPVKDLTAPEVRSAATETLERVIMAGRNQMPAFGEMLSPRKIQAVIGHLKQLGEKK